MGNAVPPEVTDRARLAAVRATNLLDTPPEAAFDRLASLAATVLEAPFAFVTLVDDTRSYWKARVGEGLTATQNPVEESFCQYVVGSGERLIVGDTSADDRTKDNPSIRSMGVAAWAGFPIHAPTGEVLGTFCVVDLVTREWSEHDVSILETLSSAASGEIALRDAVAKAERHAMELAESADRASTLARTLQESLLPPQLPDIPGAEVAARFLAAGRGEVLGDFYDVYAMNDTTWAVVVGDVSGKGVPAAKVAALARYTVRAASTHHEAPYAILDELNEALMQQHPHGDEGFVTALFMTLRMNGDGVDALVSSGGHPPALVRRTDGTVERVLCGGRLLGIFEDARLNDTAVALAPGDLLLVYSDGVPEARSPEGQFGEDRLEAMLGSTSGQSAADTVMAIEAAVIRHAPEWRSDDVTLLAVRVADPGSGAIWWR